MIMMGGVARRAIAGLALCTAAGAVALGAAAALSPQDSVRMQQKLALIVANAHAAGTARTRTEITEIEINSYLRYGLADAMPVGVTDPSVVIEGRGRLSGRAVVDLSRAAKENGSGGLFDPLTYLTGRLPVEASGVLHATGGAGTFELESASVSGVPIPKLVLQEILTAYSRSASRPDGLNIDAPFTLPAGIREIEMKPGQAVIVQ